MSNQTSFRGSIIRGLVNGLIAPIGHGLDSIGMYTGVWKFLGKRGPMNDPSNIGFGDYQASSHDVLVCTFAKSGTNWMLQITQQIAHKGQSEFHHVHEVIAWPDMTLLPAIPLDDPTPLQTSPTGLRVIKTHFPLQRVPYNTEAKYITVIRDPKDVFVSSYHFVKGSMAGKLMPSVETWLKLYLTPHFMMGNWAEHTASYWAERDKPNMMVMTYQDLKANSETYIQEVVDFMGVTLTNSELADVHEKASFPYMKQRDEQFAPAAYPPWITTKAQMMRQGKSGVASEMLTIDQQRSIDSYMQAELKRLGSDFPYAELFDLA